MRGGVDGLPESTVTASLIGGKLSARIDLGADATLHVEPLSNLTPNAISGPSSHVVYRGENLAPHGKGCGADDAAHPKADFAAMRLRDDGGVAATQRRICAVAFDTDVEFFQKNGGSTAAVVNDIENIMNQVSLLYETEAGITFEVTTIIVRTAEPDPYTSSNHNTLLTQFSNHWNVNMPGVHRDVAHLMTGKQIENDIIGSANNGVICDVCGAARGYGFSASRFTLFMPSRVCLTAHELGHNFSARHCDGDSDCYIMCSVLGGCADDCTRFGSRSLASIASHAAASSCLATLAPPVSLPFCETFGAVLDNTHWSYNAAASVSAGATDPPSPPHTMLIDTCCTGCAAAPDEIRSNFILLAETPEATFSYHTQHGRGTTGSQLVIDYWNNAQRWMELNRITAGNTAQTAFTFWSHALPPDAFHDRFRIRFRVENAANQAVWFIDDVSVSAFNPEQPMLFVRAEAPPGGSGTSWASAFNDLQEALSVAACSRSVVEEIWLARGTYKPDRGSGDRTASFALVNNIAIVGGFAGIETSKNQRNVAANPTVLSGDIGMPFNTSDNSFHVVTAEGVNDTAVLDGLTIIAGNANGASPNNGGGGLLISGGTPTIINCLFRANLAAKGAGVLNFAAAPTLVNCGFVANTAASLSGGGMYNSGGSTPTLIRCRFLGNTASPAGGGIYNFDSSTTFTSCAFSGNQAPTGAAVYNGFASATFTNCTISRNFGFSSAGGIVNNASSSTLRSCILWGNTDLGPPDESAQLSGPSFTVDYSTVTGWTGALGGVDNNGNDPLTADSDGPDNIIGTLDDDFRLTAGSPAIDTGDPTMPPNPDERDLDGHARILCGVIDRGAYEYGVGDLDCDEDVDLPDFSGWAGCLTGPSNGPVPAGCDPFDFDGDADIDLDDWGGLQRAFRPAAP